MSFTSGATARSRLRMLGPSLLFASVLLLSYLQNVSGLDCEWGGSKTLLDKVNVLNPKSCPSLIDDKDKIFCCVDGSTGLNVCCDAKDFLGPEFVAIIGITLVAVALLTCCLCCCCCPCCALYKRRHAGAVYGRVVQPGTETVVTVHQSAQPAYPVQPMVTIVPQPMVNYVPAQSYTAYPSAGQQPPPYSEATANEVYSKQAPYNPHYQ